METASVALALLLVATLGAGCIGIADENAAQGSNDPAQAVARLQTITADLPCEVASVALDATSKNLMVAGNLSFGDSGEHGELDIRGNLAAVAAFSAGGFELVDLSDPTSPRIVATYLSEKTRGMDVKFSPDGADVLLGNKEGVDVVDIRDPLNPVRESYWELPASPTRQEAHMLTTAHIGDKDWVFLAPIANRGVDMLTLDGEPGGRMLTFVRSWVPFTLLTAGPLGPHDTWVTVDEKLGKPLIYVANGFEGWAVADISDPANPKDLGFTPNQDPHQGYVHTVRAAWIGERRLVATMQEVGANSLKIYDATDLGRPLLVGSWVYDPIYSTYPEHNLQVVGDKLYMAHYREGLFVFNLSAIPATPATGLYQLRPMAHLAGPGEAGAEGLVLGQDRYYGGIVDVVVREGILHVTVMEEGLSSVAFGCLTPGDPALSSSG